MSPAHHPRGAHCRGPAPGADPVTVSLGEIMKSTGFARRSVPAIAGADGGLAVLAAQPPSTTPWQEPSRAGPATARPATPPAARPPPPRARPPRRQNLRLTPSAAATAAGGTSGLATALTPGTGTTYGGNTSDALGYDDDPIRSARPGRPEEDVLQGPGPASYHAGERHPKHHHRSGCRHGRHDDHGPGDVAGHGHRDCTRSRTLTATVTGAGQRHRGVLQRRHLDG